MSDLNNKPVKDIDDMHDKQVEKMLTKGGPGDRSTPGNVNTEEWWKWEKPSYFFRGRRVPIDLIRGDVRYDIE